MRDNFATHPGSPQRQISLLSRLIFRHGQKNRYRRPDEMLPGPLAHALKQAKLLQDGGDLDGAMALYKDVERLCHELGNKDGLAYSLSSQALIFQKLGDLAGATAAHKEAQCLYVELNDQEGMVDSLNNRAEVARDRADFDGAMALYKEVERLYMDLGNRNDVAGLLHNQAQTLEESKDLNRVLELFSLILFAVRAEARQLNFVPFHSSGIYGLGEKVGWTVALMRGSAAPAKKYTYEIKKNNLATIQRGTLSFESGSATIATTLQEPAMIYVTVNAVGAPPSSAVHLGAAIAPAQLRPSVPRPADFDAFWDAKLQELNRIAMNPVATPLACGDGVELLRVRVDSWNSQAHGYLAKPALPRKFPALVVFQYAGVYAARPTNVLRRASQGWLALGVAAHDLPPDQTDGVSPNYEVIGNTSRETSYFLKMYLRAVRAVDFITSYPDWDGETLVLMGTCMGGQQALVAAALRPQVTAVIANQPSGADFHGGLNGRKPGYPYWSSDDPEVMAAALYFDIVHFAPRIQAPMLASMGFVDTTSPPAGIWTVLNQLAGPKEVIAMIELDHTSRTPEKRGVFRSRVKEVLETLLLGGQFTPNR